MAPRSAARNLGCCALLAWILPYRLLLRHRLWFRLRKSEAELHSLQDVERCQCLLTASGLVEVDVDALQLQVTVTMVGASWVDAMLVGDDLQRGRSSSSALCPGFRRKLARCSLPLIAVLL